MVANRRTDGIVVDSPSGSSESKRAAQLAQARDERRRQAEAHAEQLLAEARAADPNAVIQHTLQLLMQALRVDHVTLSMGPELQPHAVFCASRRATRDVSSSSEGKDDSHASLCVEGAISRLHVFVYDAGRPGLDGRLSVHSMQARSFGAAEVALVHAIAELLAHEVEGGRLPPRHQGAATSARHVQPTGA